MKNNNEVTLRIEKEINEFKEELKKKGFEETEHFILDDIFMIPSSLKINELSTREIISNAIIIRKVNDFTKDEVRRDVSYKMKKFNENGDIIEQKSTRLKILDCNDAEKFFETIGYKTIMNITEEDYGFAKDGMYITTKDVKNGDNMIEAETQYDNSKYDTIEKVLKWLEKENLSLDFSDLYIKKAEVELNKILNRR